MTLLVAATLLAQLAASPAISIQRLELVVPDVGTIRYGIAFPDKSNETGPRPLVLALHPGDGAGKAFYGAWFMEEIVAPSLFGTSPVDSTGLTPIIVAPDCPARAWNDPLAERAVLALLTDVMNRFRVDRRSILVTGFSLGGHGTWFFSSHHADLFTGAIVMAGSVRDEPIERLATIPTYVIHGRNDVVVPFAPAEENARALQKLGRTVKFDALDDVDHYNMGKYKAALTRGWRWIVEGWDRG